MSLAQENLKRWNDCHISAEMGPVFKQVADKINLPQNRQRYEAVAKMIKEAGYDLMPWQFIAVAHHRESNGNFNTYLGNGEPLNKKTTLVPKGRGPFKDWEAGALDALINCAPYAAKNKDWSIGGTLAKLEEYNGLGYSRMGKPSPYLWAGTDQYDKGKYVADGKYDPTVVDKQLGAAGILKFLGYGRTAPTGLGTVVVAAGTAAGAAVATTQTHWWNWAIDHWMVIGIVVVGLAIVIDLGIALYNNEKNQLNVG